jgi:hypothetical protein
MFNYNDSTLVSNLKLIFIFVVCAGILLAAVKHDENVCIKNGGKWVSGYSVVSGDVSYYCVK